MESSHYNCKTQFLECSDNALRHGAKLLHTRRQSPDIQSRTREIFNASETMTKTYAQIVKQIESLKMDAEKLRRKEMDGVIGRIREAITVYNLTAEDLGFGGKAKKAAGKAAAPAKRGKAKAASPKAPAEVKYQNETGGTWGGRGKRPQWLRDALAAGKQLADFAVKK